MSKKLIYESNPKHKRGAVGGGPPRWFPDPASLCPDSIDVNTAQELLLESHLDPGADTASRDRGARYAYFQGDFYKAYRTKETIDLEIWHGFPVFRENIRREIPARVLRFFQRQGRITKAECKKFFGSAR